MVAFLRNRQALFDRPPRGALAQLPRRGDARPVQGTGRGDGPRLRARRDESFPQPFASLVRVPPFLLEQPEIRRELERVGSPPMLQKPGERGLQPVMIPFQSIHPRRIVRSHQMRFRLRGKREQRLRAASLPCLPGHVAPPLRIADSLLQGSRRVNRWIIRRGYAKNRPPCAYARREIASADQKAALRSCSSCRGEKNT